MPYLSLPPYRVLLALVCFSTLGCQPEPQVETYTTVRTAPPRPVLDAAAVLEQLDHILVAIVPHDDKAWFFKLVGKAAAIRRQREAFEGFLKTVMLAPSPAETPSWQLPQGWETKEATAMRAATLVVPDSDGPLELAVSSLPMKEAWEDFLVPNVNRWLGQLRRSELSKDAILALKREAPTADAESVLFELSGVMAQSPMGSNPHAGLGIAPPSDKTPPEPAAAKSFTYTTPDGWLEGQMSPMRKAAFLLPGGGPMDTVTVTSFADAPGTQMSDIAANVQRWAGQVGMTPPTSEALDKLVEKLTIGGIEASCVELTSPPGVATQRAIYVAMLERQGQVWFFKMDGQPDLVEGQRDAFREFLDSVQFP